MSRAFVIAEAAACHDGDLIKAHRLVNLAGAIGADACKFQWLSSPERLAERRHAPEYLTAYRLLAFPREWHDYLAAHCAERKLEYMCTTYLPEDVAVIASHVKRFKVSSFEATDHHFVALHAEWPDKPLIISAGMGADLRPSLAAYFRGYQLARDPVTVLHCVSAYPCPPEQLNLLALRQSPWELPSPCGLSDHTRHPWTGALAVAAGAQVIEFHVRLDDTDPANADYAVARAPAEALEYVRNVRFAEAVLGDGIRRAMPAERAMLRYRVGAKDETA